MNCSYRCLAVVVLCLGVGCTKVGSLIEWPEIAGTYSSDGGTTNLTIERLDGSSYAVTLPDGRIATCGLTESLLEGKLGNDTIWIKTAGSKITVNASGKQTEFSKITKDLRPIIAAKVLASTKAVEPTPSTLSFDNKAKPVQVRQIRFTATEDGDCQLVVDTRSEGLVHDEPTGEPASVAGVTSAVVRKTEKDTYRIAYSFREVGSTVDFARLNGTMPQPLDSVSIDRTAGTLVMTPVASDPSQNKKAKFSFPRQVKTPISITLDFEKLTQGTFVLQLQSESGTFGLNVTPDGAHNDVKIEAFWIPYVVGQSSKPEGLLGRTLDPEKVSECGFHVPTHSTILRERFLLTFGIHGQELVVINRLEVEAKLMPSFGMAWGPDKGKLRITSVVKGSPSDRAKLQNGDGLVSINDQKPSDLKDLLARLAVLPIGEDVKFVIRRGSREMTIAMKGE